ncbi:MAG: hypothetical protein KDI56_06695 [Xanthomonadales bacterium]|nr:hypothetical protein [Xanthomonadales bacterium]
MIRPTRSNSRIAACLWAVLLPLTPALAADFEAPAVVPAAQLLGELPLRGEGYEIRSEATIVDFYGRFVVQTDLGLFAVDGVDLLQQRLAEMPAARVLEEASALVVLGDTAQRRLRRPFEQGAKVASEPGTTAKRVPQGIGRFLSRTARRAQKLFWRIGDAASDRWRRNDEPTAANESETPERESSKLAAAQSIGLDYIGYDKARRELAQRLGIDPYTSHPLINQRLDDLAWSAWVGNKSASLMLGAVVGGALDQALDISGDAYRLAWAESPMDIELHNQRQLEALGLRGRPVRDFLRNGAFNPLLQTALVERIGESAYSTLRPELLDLATQMDNEREARFLLAQLAELSAAGRRGRGLPRVGLIGQTLVLDQGDGRLSVILPVDWVSWDPAIAEFAQRPELREHRPQLLVNGSLSQRAQREFNALGWQWQEHWSARTDPAGS